MCTPCLHLRFMAGNSSICNTSKGIKARGALLCPSRRGTRTGALNARASTCAMGLMWLLPGARIQVELTFAACARQQRGAPECSIRELAPVHSRQSSKASARRPAGPSCC